MNTDLNDFPLESQRECTCIQVSIKKEGVLLTEKCEDEVQMILLNAEQVIELFRLCRGRILGRLSGEHLQYMQSLDQCAEYLRENAEIILRISNSQEAAEGFIEVYEPTDTVNLAGLLRCLCLVTRSLLQDRTQVPIHPDDDHPNHRDSQEN